MAEGQHGFLQEVGGNDLLPVVVVELAKLAGDALLYGEPLPGRVAVQQKHFEEPGHAGREGGQVSHTGFMRKLVTVQVSGLFTINTLFRFLAKISDKTSFIHHVY